MAIVEVKVPQLSESVAEATMMQWKKKAGDAVVADEILIEIETDKVVLEVPAPASGVLAELVVEGGATVAGEQLMEHAKAKKGSGVPQTNKVGSVTWEQVKLIAEDKMADLNCFSVESAMSMVAGTARSMGITVSGESPISK